MTDIPFNRDAANTVDAYVNRSNRADAIAEATKLPRLVVDNATEPGWVARTPQASSVSWALWMARKGEFNAIETMVLVALAQHAAAALWSGDGYSYSTAEDIAALLPGFTASRVRTHIQPGRKVWQVVEERTGLVDHYADVIGWRIPDEALDGNWLDRAARQVHYGKANDHVRR